MDVLEGRDEARDEGRERRVATPLLLVSLLVAGLLAGGGATWLLLSRESAPTARAELCSRIRSVELAVAPELYAAVVTALDENTPRCTRVTPAMRPGSEVALGVALGGALPDVWIPEAHFLMSKAYVGSS